MRSSLRWIAALVALVAAGGLAPAHAETITLGGSGAALGTLRLLGAAFTKANPAITVEVAPSLGTAGGVRAVSRGALEIAAAGRELTAKERIFPLRQVEFAKTAFVFVTSNVKAEPLTRSSLEAIVREQQRAWNDGTPIRIILRPREDADFGFFTARFPAMASDYERLLSRPELTVATTDQDNADLAETTAGSFATSTLIQLVSEKRRLKILAFDGVEPGMAISNRALTRSCAPTT